MEHRDHERPAQAETRQLSVRPCELRVERRTRDADGRERVEYICGASGGPEQGYLLGVAGEDLSAMQALCNACPIPDALASRRACLNLVPVRRFSPGPEQNEAPDAFFPCRWFYPLYGQHQPRDLTVCQSCPHWFPRPPRELIPDYWPETRRMLRVINGVEKTTAHVPTGFTPLPHATPAGPWWRRLLHKMHL